MLILNQLRRLLSPILLLSTICNNGLTVTSAGGEESSEFTYRSNVSEVRLLFFANAEHNRPVPDLGKDDFAVIDDETIIRDFRSFMRSGVRKLDVVLLVDSSESVLPQFKREIAQILQLISQVPWSRDDNLSVVSFSGMDVHLLCSGNCRNSITTNQLVSLPSGGATPLFDAIEIAANLLIRRRQPDVWPVIVVFSDGDDTISQASFQDALQKIRTSEALVYAIDVSPLDRPSNGTAALQALADESGGRCIRISEGCARFFNQVIDDLHSAYVVTYKLPTSGSQFHSIRILPTHNLKLNFRCRRGYYSSSSPTKKEEGL